MIERISKMPSEEKELLKALFGKEYIESEEKRLDNMTDEELKEEYSNFQKWLEDQ